jgi:hypothetical protein
MYSYTKKTIRNLHHPYMTSWACIVFSAPNLSGCIELERAFQKKKKTQNLTISYQIITFTLQSDHDLLLGV